MTRARHAGPSLHRRGVVATSTALCLAAVTLLGPQTATAVPRDVDPGDASLPVSGAHGAPAAIGFHDLTRDGSEREVRDDLDGDLGGMVELAQASTVGPTGNAEQDRPTVVADRSTLLMFTPTGDVQSVSVEVRVDGAVQGSLDLDAPYLLPASDQEDDGRGSVAYSLRAWSAQLPAQWVQPGVTLSFTADDGRSGTVDRVDVAAPTELVINNVRLGMLTDAPTSDDEHPFITDPAASASDYFQTLPVSKLTMAQYEDVTLDEVIVGTGDIYTVEDPDPGEGSVYAGTMREDVGKAQVSTGINLATWGITSSPMTQKQPGHTNQRVIHHSAGRYANGVHKHGLSGGNGMATLYTSTGNELSHELGHSYGIGHFPGTDEDATGDDAVRDSSHHMDSGWGYIAYRGLMRSNLSTAAFQESADVNGHPFNENLAGLYNFNRDAMAGGWDASPVSQYTHHTAYTLTRIQESLRTLVADTDYPSGYRDWDADAGAWVDAAELDPELDLLAPEQTGVPVFTILGGYNPADADQTLVYPAFRSNYGVTFDLPQAETESTSTERVCWLEVTFDGAETQHVALDASDGVKQLNVNVAESERPTGAQVACRADGTTTTLGEPIEIATDLEPMADAVVVGQEAGYETLRAVELAELEPTLEALAQEEAPVLESADLVALQGWSDDLSQLSDTARTVADRILGLVADATQVEAYLAEHGGGGTTAEDLPELAEFLTAKGYVDEQGSVLPTGAPVTVDGGHCLYVEGGVSLVDGDAEGCGDTRDDQWFVDVADRIHPVANPEACLAPATPALMRPCSISDPDQRWVVEDDGYVVREADTGSALDYDRAAEHAGLYALSGTSNQVWEGFTTNDNPLLAYLSADGLAALVGNGAAATPASEVADTDAHAEAKAAAEEVMGDAAAADEHPDHAGTGTEAEAEAAGGETLADQGSALALTGAQVVWAVVVAVVLLGAGVALVLVRRRGARR